MFEQKITALPGDRRCHTVAFSGFDAHGGALLMCLTGIYDTHKRLLYRECHQKRDLEDCLMQHDGIVAGVQDGRIRLTTVTPAQRERERGRALGKGRESERGAP